jgi:hypothetical protein
MPIQTTYGFTNDALLRGMTASMLSVEAETAYASAAIEFGLGLVFDDAQDGDRKRVKVPAAAGETFVGIAAFDHTRPVSGEIDGLTVLESTQTVQYRAGDAIKLIRRGRIVVQVEEAVTPESAVFLRHTANGAGTAPGYFRTDIDTDGAIDVSAFCKFATTTAGAGLAYLDINLP